MSEIGIGVVALPGGIKSVNIVESGSCVGIGVEPGYSWCRGRGKKGSGKEQKGSNERYEGVLIAETAHHQEKGS